MFLHVLFLAQDYNIFKNNKEWHIKLCPLNTLFLTPPPLRLSMTYHVWALFHLLEELVVFDGGNLPLCLQVFLDSLREFFLLLSGAVADTRRKYVHVDGAVSGIKCRLLQSLVVQPENQRRKRLSLICGSSFENWLHFLRHIIQLQERAHQINV